MGIYYPQKSLRAAPLKYGPPGNNEIIFGKGPQVFITQESLSGEDKNLNY